MEDRCRALETDKEAILASNAAVRVDAVQMLLHDLVAYLPIFVHLTL